jgi:hypothetical protein
VQLPHLRLRLPFHLCLQCRATLASLDAAVGASPDRRLHVLAACSVLTSAPWWGEGERVTTAARSAMSAARAVATVPLSMVGGLLGGLCLGGLMGGSMGALGGGTVAFDAGNRLTGASKPAAAAAAAAAARPAAPAAPADAPPPYLAALASRLKALPLLDEGEREADAAREAARMEAPAATAYDVLGVPPDAPLEALSRAHKLLSLAYHPDRNPAPSASRVSAAINAAAALVCDAEKRAAYDAGGRTRAAADAVAAEGTSTAPTVALSTTVAGKAGGFLGGVVGGALGLLGGAAVGALGGAVKGAASSAAAAWEARQKVRSAGDTVRRAAAEAARTAAGGAPPAPLALSARGAALRVALRGVARGVALPPLAPVRVPDVAALTETAFLPSAAYLRRIGACADGGEEGAHFSVRLASAAAAVAAAARAELGLPEPQPDGGEGDAGGGDATGMGGGDTYEDAAARAAARHGGPITSGGGLLKLAYREALSKVGGLHAEEEARALAARGAVWEATTRGRAPTGEWVARRVAGLLRGGGGGGEEEGGGGGEGGGEGGGGGAITDPDKGWGAEGAPLAGAGSAAPRFVLEMRAVGDAQWAPAGALTPADGAEEGGEGGLFLSEVPLPVKKTEARALLVLQRDGKPEERVVVAEGVFAP